ncbi:YbdK family carboxylate-amine ligase [Actinoplanes sp. NPDC049316]|uniref:carboxylate-amine ligase n=1 Tax=Actinoplanes sp. NPDC049316 TaxID=3154727 RepID=UPI003414E9E7
MGVEEEFLLLADDGSVRPVGAAVVAAARLPGQVKPEYMRYQVETASAVCTRVEDLRRDLVRLRVAVAEAADRAGARLIAVGAAPLAAGPRQALSGDERYRELARRYPGPTAPGATCACQVHVGIADREVAVAVLGRLRPWLPALLALTVNSPYAGGVDTGWASIRYRLQRRWPTFRPPGVWADAQRYDSVVASLVTSGAALDPAAVYFLARLSSRYPTIEVRVADTCLEVDDTVVYAATVRALVAGLVDDVRRGVPARPVPGRLINARLLAAARGTGPAVGDLMAKVEPYLAGSDAGVVRDGLQRMLHLGTGAERQRRMRALPGDPRRFVRLLAEATVPVATVS